MEQEEDGLGGSPELLNYNMSTSHVRIQRHLGLGHTSHIPNMLPGDKGSFTDTEWLRGCYPYILPCFWNLTILSGLNGAST